ncbi:lipopolysaccharide core heptose(II) kinase RfaY [Escherichia coli]|uniref:lipopolysaccharide core heptose(II) kinase RfaY n=1 Tax=Escherichia coli TaxID=562 RepID=UPI003EECEC6A
MKPDRVSRSAGLTFPNDFYCSCSVIFFNYASVFLLCLIRMYVEGRRAEWCADYSRKCQNRN